MVNGALNIIPISLALLQMLQIIIMQWKPKAIRELKDKYHNLGFQVGTILSATINFRPNKN